MREIRTSGLMSGDGKRDGTPLPRSSSTLLRDGHDVVKLESAAGETIETDDIKRLCGR
jgi:hypothetical protein